LRGKKYVIFIEDNNLLQFKVIPHLLGKLINENKSCMISGLKRLDGEQFCSIVEDQNNKEQAMKRYFVAYPFNYDMSGRIDLKVGLKKSQLMFDFQKQQENNPNNFTPFDENNFTNEIEEFRKEIESKFNEMPQLTGLFIIRTDVYKDTLTRNKKEPFE